MVHTKRSPSLELSTALTEDRVEKFELIFLVYAIIFTKSNIHRHTNMLYCGKDYLKLIDAFQRLCTFLVKLIDTVLHLRTEYIPNIGATQIQGFTI